MEKTVLVAVDGSVHSSHSLDYLVRMFGPTPGLSLHLLSVAPAGGGGKEWMYDVDPLRSPSAATERQVQLAWHRLREAEDRLVREGFSREQIECRVKTATGIGSAICEEAVRGNYDSVLIGRRGLGAMGALFFGSISGEVIEKCHNTPVWIVDGTVSTTKILLAVHSHPASLMAADHLAFILKGHPSAEICLYHSNSVFGAQQAAEPEAFHAQWGQAWCDQYLDLDNYLFYAHAQLLAENGIPRHRISQLPMRMHLDISADLLRQAKQHNCGTIVIGRRRRDRGKHLIKGVSDRTLSQAENIAIWLTG